MSLVENRFVDTAGEGESGTSRESSIDIYTPSCVKQTVSGKLLNNSGNPAWHSRMTQSGGMMGEEEGRRGKGYIYIHISSDHYDTHMSLRPSRVVIRQKPTQHYKVILHQLKNKTFFFKESLNKANSLSSQRIRKGQPRDNHCHF